MDLRADNKTESYKETLEKILLPFKEEYRRKCRNDSVIGGFDRYALTWLDRTIGKCPPKNVIRQRLEEIREKLSRYSLVLPRERAKILKETYILIKSIIEGDIAGSVEKKIEGDNTAISEFSDEYLGEGLKLEKWSKPSALTTPPSMEVKRQVAQKIIGQKKNFRLDDPVTEITGIGEHTANLLRKMNLNTVEDILFHLPREYQDRRKVVGLDNIEAGKFQVILGTIGNIIRKNIRPNLHLTKVGFYDENGTMFLTWFNQPYIGRNLKQGKKYIAMGKVEYKYGEAQINNPELEEWEDQKAEEKCLTPIYPLSEGLSQKFMRKIVAACVRKYADLLIEVFPDDLRKKLGLLSINEAIRKLHSPEDFEEAEKAKLRILFEEAFLLQFVLARYRRRHRKNLKERQYYHSPHFMQKFEENLDFALTNAQRKVIGEILQDMQSPYPMNRLLQGDVGSGKTIVCIYFTLLAAESGFQTAIMAATEVLAEQHYYTFRDILGKFGIEIRLLIGATDPAEKAEIKALLQSGKLKAVVGTHALIQEDVKFANLAFAVVDEQHKFGVMQRATLKEKGQGADFLFTTATPIPRSMCLTLYGDLDVSVIDEIPPGRQPIKTLWVTEKEKSKAYKFVENEIKQGGQAYIICPLIEESETMELTPLLQEYENVKKQFPDFSVGILHGKMKGQEKQKTMQDFCSGLYQILVATTVVEVGVHVSGASVMVILDAQRFGLGQLHQLRGRIGRGTRKSTCILVSAEAEDSASERLKILTKTTSGFEIAEADLRMRGPGELVGIKQSGFPELKFLNIVRDYNIILKAREIAFLLEKEDPDLSHKEYIHLRERINDRYRAIWDIIH